VIAAAAAVQYLKDTEHHNLAHITKMTKLTDEKNVWLDRFTIRNLRVDLFTHPDGKTFWMYWILPLLPWAHVCLRRWLVMPLLDKAKIEERLHGYLFC
jgi:DNA mismatch repair protein MutS